MIYTINTNTKKFTSAVAINLTDLRKFYQLDFELVDGDNKPVICQGKNLVLTISNITFRTYATDGNFASFRRMYYGDDFTSGAKTAVLTMDSDEILSDTITYTVPTTAETDPVYTADKPTIALKSEIKDATITLTQGGVTKGTFTTNQANNATIALDAGGGSVNDSTDYLCFTPSYSSSATVRLDKNGSPRTINLEYSTDKVTWTTYTWSGNTGATITLAVGQKVWFRGNNPSGFSNNYSNYYFFKTGCVNASGNIMSLLDKTCNLTTIPCDFCFCNLFASYSNLATAPALPATTLTQGCYYYMFQGCTSLTTAPALPATTLTYGCYYYMFQGCTILTTAPALPATTLNQSCYEGMFENCTSLTTAPALPAKYLQYYCYKYMFNNCTSLKTAQIDAISEYIDEESQLTADHCMECMFNGCTSLKKLKCAFPNLISQYTNSWLGGTSATNSQIAISYKVNIDQLYNNEIPEGWYIVKFDAENIDESLQNVYQITNSSFTITPSSNVTYYITSNNTSTLDAKTYLSNKACYANIIIYGSVTAGSNITIVDTLQDNKRNICVVRWSNGTAKLYVVDTQTI